jgi:AcrR family transcriptional regulator
VSSAPAAPSLGQGQDEPTAPGARRERRDVVRNREALLGSAAQAFSRHGVDASLEDIAHHAGVGSATLYRHFPTRDDLIANVYRRDTESLCADVDALLTELPADEALARWMARFVSYVAGRRGMAAALKGAVCRSEPFRATRAQLLDALARLITPGVSEGLLRADATPDDAMKAMGALCLLAEHSPDSPGDISRLVELLVDGLRHGAPSGRGS